MTNPVFDHLTLLSEPLRVRTLRLLEREELAVGEISRVLQVPQPTVSRHLKQLDEAGWVAKRRSGTAIYVRLAPLNDAQALWDVVRTGVEAGEDAVSVYAEDLRRLDGVIAARTGDSEELFRRLGSRWDGVRQELFGESFVLPTLLAMLPAGLRVADIGCGTGATLAALAAVAAEVVGIDREDAMLDVARHRIPGCENVVLRRGLLDDLPLTAGTQDIVLCQLVLHHVRVLEPVFLEVARVLAAGGRWVILDMVEHDREDYRTTMGHQHLGFSPETLAELAAPAGLRVCSHRILPVDPTALGPGLFVAVLEPSLDRAPSI